MAHGDISGRARTNPRSPRGFGVCDRCGEWYQLHDLRRQMQWTGTSLTWLGWLVCPHCYDAPQQQGRTILLPPDPVPISNPRPENFDSDYGLQGFTQYQLFQPQQAEQTTVAVLAVLAALSGVPTPGGAVDRSGTLAAADTPQQIMAPNAGRTWAYVYNPSNPQLQVSLGTTIWGGKLNIVIGPGLAILASGAGATPLGALTAIGLIPDVPFYAGEG